MHQQCIDPVERARQFNIERARQFKAGQRIQLACAIDSFYPAGAAGTIFHQETQGSFAVKMDRQYSDTVHVSLDADEIESEAK